MSWGLRWGFSLASLCMLPESPLCTLQMHVISQDSTAKGCPGSGGPASKDREQSQTSQGHLYPCIAFLAPDCCCSNWGQSVSAL